MVLRQLKVSQLSNGVLIGSCSEKETLCCNVLHRTFKASLKKKKKQAHGQNLFIEAYLLFISAKISIENLCKNVNEKMGEIITLIMLHVIMNREQICPISFYFLHNYTMLKCSKAGKFNYKRSTPGSRFHSEFYLYLIWGKTNTS